MKIVLFLIVVSSVVLSGMAISGHADAVISEYAYWQVDSDIVSHDYRYVVVEQPEITYR